MNCILCKTDTKDDSNCPYCGLYVVEELDDSISDMNESRVNTYRKKILSNIKAIGIKVFKYKLDGGEIKQDSVSRLKVASGIEAYEKICWTSEKNTRRAEKTLTISMLIEDSHNNINEVTVDIPTPDYKEPDFYYVGVSITKELKLIVYLGNKETHSCAKDIPITLPINI